MWKMVIITMDIEKIKLDKGNWECWGGGEFWQGSRGSLHVAVLNTIRLNKSHWKDEI